MNRRHLTEGQKPVLANEYMKVLSKKAKTQRAEIANAVKYGKVSLSETVTDKASERHEVDTRKEASYKFKVSERKVRSSEYSKVINPPWRRQSHPRTIENKNAPVRRLPTNLTKATSHRALWPTR